MKSNTKNKISKDEKVRIRITKKILKAKNKTSECLKLGISKSTYYVWRNKSLTTGRIQNANTKPNTSPNSITDEKIITLVKMLYLDGRGKYYIKAVLTKNGYSIGTSAIKGIVKRLGLWRSKKHKPKKRYDKNKYAENIKIAGEMVQIDTKYAKIKGKRIYQFTAIDLATKMTWAKIYENITPYCARKFLEYLVADAPFKIQTIQTDNGSEYTYKKCFPHTDKETQFELACKKYNIRLRHIPVGQPRFNGSVERVHGTYEREFYQKVGSNFSLQQIQEKLKHFTIFYNTKRLHSSLKYNTILQNLKLQEIPIPISLTP